MQPDFTGMSLEEIRDNLEAENVGLESLTYVKELTDDELQKMEADHLEMSKNYAAVEAELEAVSKPLKDRVKSFKKMLKETIQTLRKGGVVTTGEVYLIPNYETNTMYQYSIDGKVVGVRALARSERQLTINSIKHFKKEANG